MIRLFLLVLLAGGSLAPALAQQVVTPIIPKNKYGLPVITKISLYQQHVAANPDHELVELTKHIPGLVLDIKYATKDNLVKERVYNLVTAYARKPVADALAQVQAELRKQGLGLKVYDGYRPYHVTELFFKKVKEKDYVANPKDGSRHNRGCAIDLTIINLKDGKELEMPTPYDATVVQSHADYPHVTEQAKKNRALLIDVMQRHGFTVFPKEWWHYDFNAWRNYPLMDISFEQLKKT